MESSKILTWSKNKVNSLMGIFGLKLVRLESPEGLSLYKSGKWKNAILVNIGAGNFRHRAWTNLDMPNAFYKHLQERNKFIPYDICSLEPLPFSDESVDVFYLSHVIEHITDRNLDFLLSETKKKLKPGGVIRITCPDMELQYNAYSLSDRSFWRQPSPWGTCNDAIEMRFLEHFATLLVSPHREKMPELDLPVLQKEELDYIYDIKSMNAFFDDIIALLPSCANSIFPQGHCNWFSYKKILAALEDAGFSKFYRSAFGQSSLDILRDINLFDNTCPELSLYVEAVK